MARHRVYDCLKKGLIGGALLGVSWCAYADKLEYLRPEAIPAPRNNQITAERVELGEKLFFDPRLSDTNTMSCASCHHPPKAWSGGVVAKFDQDQHLTSRSISTLINVAYQRHFMWDGRIRTLELQVLDPLTSEMEMNQDPDELIVELGNISAYQTLFEKAYPGEGITLTTITKAIASFERTIVSAESPFDRWIKGDEAAISEAAKHGFDLFEGKANCIACHHGFNFTDNSFHNTGLKGGGDPGRFAVVPVMILKGAFKTPTLRDVTLSEPYMHNGIYKTLEEVIDHYNRGGDLTIGIDSNIRPLYLSEQEKEELLEFLLTLTAAPIQMTKPELPQ